MFGMNPYAPYGYNAQFMGQQGQFMQPSMQQPQPAAQQPQPTQNGPGWIMAPNVQSVEQVAVTPGSKSWIMVQNAPVFALRSADQMGLVTTDYYRFEKIDPATLAAPAPAQDYVTREEFQRFVDSLTGGKPAAAAVKKPVKEASVNE